MTRSSAPICPQVEQHYDNVQDEGIQGRKNSPIINLRNFNNWIKSVLISETYALLKKKRISVFDIGAGKGGDLTKWMKFPIKYMLLADLSNKSLDAAKDRAFSLKIKFPIEYIRADVTTWHIDTGNKFDIVSCQFMLHYSFESLEQARCLIQNMASNLRSGGYAIGTTVNANEVIRRLRASSGMSFGNKIYRILFSSKRKFPVFGCKYNFYLEGVVNCPEFLVNIDALNMLAREQDLELVQISSFADYYAQHKKRFKLSKDEWEVLTLYIIFIYRKI